MGPVARTSGIQCARLIGSNPRQLIWGMSSFATEFAVLAKSFLQFQILISCPLKLRLCFHGLQAFGLDESLVNDNDNDNESEYLYSVLS